MADLLILGLGGFLGAVLRYLVAGLSQSLFKSIEFPFGTLAVNALGCLVIGVLSQMAEARGLFNPQVRLFLMVGVLGAFTTFSTFGLETVNLFRNAETLPALLNIFANLLLGLLCVIAGRAAVLALWR